MNIRTIAVAAVGVALSVVLCGGCATQRFHEGVDAYHRGEYEAAAVAFTEAADKGVVAAQYNLGFLYDKGRGVPRDDAMAVAGYRKAADKGYPRAQNNVGAMYRWGRGVPEDYIVAYAWLNLAAAQGHIQALKNRDRVAALLTPSQLEEARKLGRSYLKRYPRERLPKRALP